MTNESSFNRWKDWLMHESGSGVRLWEDDEGMADYVTYMAPDRKRFLKIHFIMADGCIYLDPGSVSHWSTPHEVAISEQDKRDALQRTMEVICKQGDRECRIDTT